MKTIIITGGSLDYEFAAAYISKEEPDCLIAADLGMQFCYEKGILPDYVMGDFDSIKGEIVSWYRAQKQVQTIGFLPEKDDTDTEIAMKKAIALGSTSIALIGAMGGRMDHCLANIHLLKLALDQGIDACLVDRQNHIRLLDCGYQIEKKEQYGTYVSFLPFTDQVEGLTLKGFKYPLEEYTMKKGISIGVSNELSEDLCTVTLKKGILMMIQSKD